MRTPSRCQFREQVVQAVAQSQLVIILGEKGLGQKPTVDAALGTVTNWETMSSNGNWLTRGYLAGIQDLFDLAFRWCNENEPIIISRHEQSIKRLFTQIDSPHFKIPKDLTNTSSKDERTRFYHHDYQNKLLVGICEFLLDYLSVKSSPLLVRIDNASSMSPTAINLLHIFQRNPASSKLIKFVLFDYERRLFITEAAKVEFSKYDFEGMNQLLRLTETYPLEKAQRIHRASLGNPMIARALVVCERGGIPVIGYLDSRATVDLYLATLPGEQRARMFSELVARDCESENYVEIRNHETFDSAMADREHHKRHCSYLAKYKAGRSPLVTVHAHHIRDKHERLEALAEPSEILKSIGLYDTWFSYFAEIFGDSQLRSHGSGDDPSNAAFINAAFVLYSLGCSKVSVPYLEEFYSNFPDSKFIPTVLYAQSMTYGRYQQPVDLPLAEKYALLNLETIDRRFRHSEKYEYIKVFAENAYAYIKARQGQYAEALALCTSGNERMLTTYGDAKFRLHQSILIYNTSQVYEIVRDYDRAEVQLRLAISYDPYYGEYHNDLGNLLAKMPDRSAEALAAYQRAIELCPPYYEAYLNRGLLHVTLGKQLLALKDFQRALEIRPTDWRAFLELGNIWAARRKYETALRMYQKALAIEPRSVDLQCNTGLAYSECGEVEASLKHYRAALALDSDHAVSHNNLAVELFKLDKLEEALLHATIAAQRSADPDYESNLGLIAGALEGSSV